MNEKQIIKRYQAGERDFRRLKLRGMNFHGADLSRADFSECDLRGTNFRDAQLVGASFSGAQCGLPKRWYLAWLIVTFMGTIFAGGFGASLCSFSLTVLAPEVIDSSLEDIVITFIALATFVVFSVVANRRGIVGGIGETITMGAILGLFIGAALSIFIVGLSLFTGDGQSVGLMFLFSILVLLALILVIEVLVVLFVPILGAISIAVAGIVPISGSFFGEEGAILAAAVVVIITFLFAISAMFPALMQRDMEGFDIQTMVNLEALGIAVSALVAITGTLFWMYIGWRIWKGDHRDAWVRSIAIAWAAVGGTCFRGANLTDANFTDANLKGGDFRNANLTRTIWRNATRLDQARPGKTYLNITKIRSLLLSGRSNSYDPDYRYLVNLQGLNLAGFNLAGANFTGSDLSESNLQGADLTAANLIGANLNDSNLQEVDLTRAKLVQTQLDNADLTGATLTGACIEDWGITIYTSFDGIRCDYVYMRFIDGDKRRRKPDGENTNFGEGEFVEFIKPLVDTLDLYHRQVKDLPRHHFAKSFFSTADTFNRKGLILQEGRQIYANQLLIIND